MANLYSKCGPISWIQVIISILIFISQIVNIFLVAGRWSYFDTLSGIYGGIWSSVISFCAAVMTLLSIKNPKEWKHLISVIAHFIGIIAAVVILYVQFSGNINHLRHRVENGSSRYYMTIPKSSLIACYYLNIFIAIATIIQIVASLFILMMTGKTICCGQKKAPRKFDQLNSRI